MAEAVLQVREVARRFGGLAAVDGVSLDLVPGRIHAVIGPNGAGKTTLVNLLSGEIKPSGGSVMFKGIEIAGLPPPRIANLGIARSYQRVNIFADFTASENCRLAAQARMSGNWRQLRPAAGETDLIATGERALALFGLAEQHGRIAGTLSHGEQRQLELAMTLASDPEVLLLDEPLAGLGAEESLRMAALIKTIAAGRAVLLIEHDMDAVFSIADDLTVMVEGKVLASGAPSAIRRDPAVRSAYLGEAVLP
ncbi:MAG TPA: ABC transporter ATP-binding protein [Stellaceae bacterium]|nr:ABC transporter ATP-binding protein [Stellaceae bacterium]